MRWFLTADRSRSPAGFAGAALWDADRPRRPRRRATTCSPIPKSCPRRWTCSSGASSWRGSSRCAASSRRRSPARCSAIPQGTVTLVEFSDYACTYCRQSVADVDALIAANPDLKVVMREYPILSPESVDAARMALAAAQQGKYAAFHDAMFRLGPPTRRDDRRGGAGGRASTWRAPARRSPAARSTASSSANAELASAARHLAARRAGWSATRRSTARSAARRSARRSRRRAGPELALPFTRRSAERPATRAADAGARRLDGHAAVHARRRSSPTRTAPSGACSSIGWGGAVLLRAMSEHRQRPAADRSWCWC